MPRVRFDQNKVDASYKFQSVKDYILYDLQSGPVDVVIQRPSKSRDQEAKYHAMIGDIAKSVTVLNRKYKPEIWKAMLVDGFDQTMALAGTPLAHQGEVVPSLDGRRVVTVRPSTTKLRKGEASQFIEYLYATGIEYGATFSDWSMKHYEDEIASRGLK